MAQVSIRGVETEGFDDGSSGTTASIPVPAGTSENELMITLIQGRTDSVSSVPSGWTLYDQIGGGATLLQAVYYKYASASEPASYSWELSGGASNNSAVGSCTTIQNAHQTSPFDAYTEASQTTTTGTFTGTAITPSTNKDCLMFFAFTINEETSISNYRFTNNNPTWTEQYESGDQSGGSLFKASLATSEYDFTSSSGDPKVDVTTTNNRNGFISLFNIRPVGLSVNVGSSTVSSQVYTSNEDVAQTYNANISNTNVTTYSSSSNLLNFRWTNENEASTTWTNEEK